MRLEDTLQIRRLGDLLPFLRDDVLIGLADRRTLERDPILFGACHAILSDREKIGAVAPPPLSRDGQIARIVAVGKRFMSLPRDHAINEPVLRRRDWRAIEAALIVMDEDRDIGFSVLAAIESGRMDLAGAEHEIERLLSERKIRPVEPVQVRNVNDEITAEQLPGILIDLIPKAHRSIRRAISGLIQDVGVSHAHFPVLKMLAECENLQMKDLLSRLQMAPPSIHAAIAAFEREGLVRKDAHPTDRRAVLLRVTPKGFEKYTECQTRIEAWSRGLPLRVPTGMAETLEFLATMTQFEDEGEGQKQLILI